MAQARGGRGNTSVSHPVFRQGWVEETRRQTRRWRRQLPPKAAQTDPDADITDVFPDMEIATPWIDGQDKTHFPTQKWYPSVLCRIIQTFMMSAIQEFYHMCLIQKSMIYYHRLRDALRIGANVDELNGNKQYLRLLKGEE